MSENRLRASLKNRNTHIYLYAEVTAILFIGICSKSSPIYPFNDWCDANCYMTVGKSMLHGIVPYRDLMEQKGPLLYMIHAVAVMFSRTTFIRVFLFEILFAASFLIICCRIIDLYYPGKRNYLWFPVIAAIVYSSKGFYHGDSAEEMCLPLLAYAIYVGLSAVKNDELPSKTEAFFIGITSGCVLWIKYTMLGIYIGWFVYFLIVSIKRKQLIKLLTVILYICIGLIAISLPILLYFVVTGSVKDLFTVYFYNNIFNYAESNSSYGKIMGILVNFYRGVSTTLKSELPAVIVILPGCINYLLAKKYKELIFILTTGLSLFIFVFIGGRSYPYYSFILTVFVPIGLIMFYRLQKIKIPRAIRKIKAQWVAITVVPIICLAIAYACSSNTYLLKYDKSEMPQYRFAKIINEKENATLLNYGFLDGGFYTVADIVPNCKYFCDLNARLPELKKTQDDMIAKGKVDFVVTRGRKLDTPNYICVDTAGFYIEGYNSTYYLYQKSDK